MEMLDRASQFGGVKSSILEQRLGRKSGDMYENASTMKQIFQVTERSA